MAEKLDPKEVVSFEKLVMSVAGVGGEGSDVQRGGVEDIKARHNHVKEARLNNQDNYVEV